MNTINSLDNLMREFDSVYRRQIIVSGEALLNGDSSSLKEVIAKVSDSAIARQISNFVNTASNNFTYFLEHVEDSSPALKVIFGGVIGGVGGAAIAEAAGLAMAIGISVISVKVIAVALILIGISITLPAIWELALKKFDQLWPELDI